MSTVAVIPETEIPATAPGSYLAAVVQEFGSPLTMEQTPMLALAAGQVRVKVEACGLCHTDIHAANGDWPIKPPPLRSSPATRASETLCVKQEMMGYTIDGAFGEYATAYAKYVVKVPDSVDSLEPPRSHARA